MTQGLTLLTFLVVSFLAVGSLLVGAKLLRVRARADSPLKRETYECGETPTGMAWVRFHARYYVVALFFVLFDVEAALILPWGTIVREVGTAGLVAVGDLRGGPDARLGLGDPERSARVGVRTVDDGSGFEHPLYRTLLSVPGLSVATTALDEVLTWGMSNALWVFPMATSCCGIEFMATAASRVDIDRMGTIVRATPRQADVMVVAGTITVKMAPRVKKLWDQMPEPKWCIAMGVCAISGDFYRNLYSVVPGIDTFLPVDVYVPGLPAESRGADARVHPAAGKNPEATQGRERHARAQPRADQRSPSHPFRAWSIASARPSSIAPRSNRRPSPPRWRRRRLCEPRFRPRRRSRCGGQAEPSGPDLPAVLTELGIPTTGEAGPPLVPASRHLEVAARLKARGYRQFVSVVATHWVPGTGRRPKAVDEPEHFEVTSLLRTVGAGSRLATWTVRLSPGEAIPSLFKLFAGADWQEREQYDLVGVVFADHPDLRRLMMPENYDRFPLRRDLPANLPYAPWR